MSGRKVDYDSMSLEDLWSLHESISALLTARIQAEKRELEKRLAFLDRRSQRAAEGATRPMTGKPRRPYPEVQPKYRNPQTAETWSGRGKPPRWLVAAMKSGRKIEEFRIKKGDSPATGQRA